MHGFKGGTLKSMWGSLRAFCVACLAELRYWILYPFFYDIYIFWLSSHHLYSNSPPSLPLTPQLNLSKLDHIPSNYVCTNTNVPVYTSYLTCHCDRDEQLVSFSENSFNLLFLRGEWGGVGLWNLLLKILSAILLF